MGEIKEVTKDDIVKEKFNLLVNALLESLQSDGKLKETLIEAKHLSENIDASGKGFDADKVDGKNASDFLGTSFVDRGDPSAYDLPLLGPDAGVWYTWDISSIVPAGAKAVLIRAAVKTTITGSGLHFRKYGNTNTPNISSFTPTIANIYVCEDLVCPISTDRKLQYLRESVGQWTNIDICIKGWWL